MSLFAELLLPPRLPVDRDEVEEALAEGFGDQLQITGAGTGLGGSNLDLEFDGSQDRAALVGEVRATLGALRVVGASMRFEGDAEAITL